MIKISIVEDIADIRESVQEIISWCDNMQVEGIFSNAEDALIGLPQIVPDIVIMDIGLPGISGNEAVRLLKPQLPNTQFLIFTVYDDDAKVWDALNAGATGYLLKTAAPEKMIEALDELYLGGSPMSPCIARKIVKIFQNQPKKENVKDIEPIKTNQNGTISKREYEVLELIAKGLLYKEIAEKLFISVGTVKQHLHNSYQKLHVNNKIEALNKLRF